MELNFVQSSEVFGKNTLAWETEFEATGDFNLHVERNKGGDILVYQRTAGSGYAIVEEFRGMDNKPAIDLDFTSVVYPKFIKIVSESQPTYATVTTDGEITEIKSQSKEVEVTSNGTMDITPDAGFAYLNSVKVKTNVAGSGEGGGEKRVYITMEALNTVKDTLNDNDSAALEVALLSYCDFIKTNNGIMSGSLSGIFSPTAMSINLSFRCYAGSFIQTFEEALKTTSEGVQAAWETLPRITEEEFYNLDNGGGSSMIEFTINGTPYQAEEGMTWGEFVESSYNDGSVNVNKSYGYIRQNGQYLSNPEGGYTMEGDAIISGFNYQYLDM